MVSIKMERKTLRVGALPWLLKECQIQVPGLTQTYIWRAFIKVSVWGYSDQWRETDIFFF